MNSFIELASETEKIIFCPADVKFFLKHGKSVNIVFKQDNSVYIKNVNNREWNKVRREILGFGRPLHYIEPYSPPENPYRLLLFSVLGAISLWLAVKLIF